MVWKFCEIWKSYGKRGPEGPKICEILSHSVRYGMYATDLDLHCLQLSIWIYSNNPDQVIWLAEN